MARVMMMDRPMMGSSLPGMAMAMCQCEATEDGVCVIGTSRDKTVCEMIPVCRGTR